MKSSAAHATMQQARRSIKLPACSVSAIRAARRSTSWRRTAMRRMYKLPDSHIGGCAAGFLLLGTQNGGHQSGAQRRAEGRKHRPERSRGLVLRGCRAYARAAAGDGCQADACAARCVCGRRGSQTPSCGRPCRTWQSASTFSCLCRRCSCAAITPP